MNVESFRTYCLSKPGVTEETPFGPDPLVFKVMGKMFALAGIENFTGIAMKVDPEIGAELREQYDAVTPAYHMDKKHWMNVKVSGDVPDKLIKQWIDNSYGLVVAKLTKKDREKLSKLAR